MDNLQNATNKAATEIPEKFQQAHESEENAVAKAKDAYKQQASKLPVPTPPAAVFHNQANAHELKTRLNWGEPNLTILDARDREAFDACHILGALNMPLDRLPDIIDGRLEHKRDIYIYAENDQQTQAAAQKLREAGFERVAELQGGLESWMEIAGSIDGTETNVDPGPEGYNVVSRLKAFAAERAKEQQMKSDTQRFS